jgi:hypothetical protein
VGSTREAHEKAREMNERMLTQFAGDDDLPERLNNYMHTGFMNQDMAKFTSQKSEAEYLAFWSTYLQKMGPIGKFIFCFMKVSFDKYYEFRMEAFIKYVPGL